MPVKYHHSLRNSGWGPSSSGKTKGRGASARWKPASAPGVSARRRETARGDGDGGGGGDENEDEDGDGQPVVSAARRAATEMRGGLIRRAGPRRGRSWRCARRGKCPRSGRRRCPGGGR